MVQSYYLGTKSCMHEGSFGYLHVAATRLGYPQLTPTIVQNYSLSDVTISKGSSRYISFEKLTILL